MTRTRDELLDALCEAVIEWRKDPWPSMTTQLRQRLAAVLDADDLPPDATAINEPTVER